MKIGLFGGTFDPVHNGHMNLAKGIINQKLLDKIIFIPAALPPHKPGIPLTPFTHRANMIKLAIKDSESFELSCIEWERAPLPSFSYDTVKLFSLKFSGDKFFLIIGEDSLANIHTWHRAKELIELCEIITYPRENEDVTLEKLEDKWPSEIAKRLIKTIIPLPTYDISATKIRSLRNHKKELASLVPLQVFDYIEKNALYREA